VRDHPFGASETQSCTFLALSIMSASSSIEKVALDELENSGISYRLFVSSMRLRNPNLVKLEGILAQQEPSSEDGRAAVIEIYDTHVAERHIHSSSALLDYVNRQHLTSSCTRRLYLPGNYVEVLGRQLRIDPHVFDQQINYGYLKRLEDVLDVPLLPSHPTSKECFTLRYPELLDFGDNAIQSFELTCTNQRRRISTIQRDGKFETIGIVRRKATFWSRMKAEKGWDGMIRTTRAI